jgi:predicted AlkP superfamily pyrophosphatase or phosphodiesterase
MKRAVLVMLDGLRPDAITSERTPTLWGLMQRGSYTLRGSSVMPSITLPCHTSIFHSVPPSRHGILDNEWHSMARPVRGLVEQLKQHDKKSGFFYNWEQLRDIARPGSLQHSFMVDTSYTLEGGDNLVADAAIPHLQQGAFDFSFVYLGTIDTAGHMFGWMSDGYLKQAAIVDGILGQVIGALTEDTTVIVHSDHGGHDRTHGTEMPEDMTIPWIMAGKGVKAGYEIQQPVSLLDTSATIVHLLGVPPVSDWEGKPVLEAFEG